MYNESPAEHTIPLKYFTIELANQLIDTKTSIDEVKGIATISGKRDGKYLSFVIEQRDHDEMQIDYSLEKNKTCDGLLIYNKLSEKFITRRLSKGSDDWTTRWLSGHILSKILSGQISEERKMIAVG